jgi:hypothetical protein
MSLSLTHRLNDSLELQYGDTTLFRYVYQPQVPASDSPRPYFHPLRTLAGNEVTIFRPYDHSWHLGLSMTATQLSGQNFWGGPTYLRDQGYVQLDNNGRVQHRTWNELSCSNELRCVEQLQWFTSENEHWIDEERQIVVREVRPEAGYWSLDLAFQITNRTQQDLAFGSPTTAGRPAAGYGGLFWRGPRSFLHGKVLADGVEEGTDVMGQAAAWLAFMGWHDGNQTRQQSTLLFIDQPGNPRYPNKWFVRTDPYACVSHAFMFDEEYILAPAETLRLSYRLVLGNGAWTRGQIEEYVQSSK